MSDCFPVQDVSLEHRQVVGQGVHSGTHGLLAPAELLKSMESDPGRGLLLVLRVIDLCSIPTVKVGETF